MASVGIVGGGAAGLCAARHLAAGGLRPRVWEAAAGTGGTWRYSPNTGTDKHGVPLYTSMYNSLRTNLPKEVMAFPDFPFPDTTASFLHHTAINDYLAQYANNFNLNQHIKTEHHVERVEPVQEGDGGPPKWAVTVRDLQREEVTSEVYDALIVCSGHYSNPLVPRLPGIENYKGRQLHSHDYRETSSFEGATVVVLGAGASGIDIAIELCSSAKQVYLSHNLDKNIASDLPKNMKQIKGATQATSDGFLLADGSEVQADTILYCTGYKFSFSYLNDDCGVKVEDTRVTPLYKHIFNSTAPSMAFIGIPLQICPFPMFDVQMRYVTKVLTGQVTLPNTTDMINDVQQLIVRHEEGNRPASDFHLLDGDQWTYMRQLTQEAGVEMLPPVVQELFTAVRKLRNQSLLTYKNTNYRLTGPQSYKVL